MYEITSTLSQQLRAETAIGQARSADDLINTVANLAGQAPAIDITLAALRQFGAISGNADLTGFVDVIDDIFNAIEV